MIDGPHTPKGATRGHGSTKRAPAVVAAYVYGALCVIIGRGEIGGS